MSRAQLDALLAESGLTPPQADELAAVLAPLTAMTDRAPAPSAELQALFAPAAGRRGPRPAPRAPLRGGRSRRGIASVVVLAVSGVGATGLSAAANTLPGPWQRQVSDFSSHYLPFHFPEPAVRRTHSTGVGSTALPQSPAKPRPAHRRTVQEQTSRSWSNLRPHAWAAPVSERASSSPWRGGQDESNGQPASGGVDPSRSGGAAPAGHGPTEPQGSAPNQQQQQEEQGTPTQRDEAGTSTSTATYRGRHERDEEARGPRAVRTPDRASIAADKADPGDRGDRGNHGGRGDQPGEPGETGQSGQVDPGDQGSGATLPGPDRSDHPADGDAGEVAADLGTHLDDGARVILEGDPSGA